MNYCLRCLQPDSRPGTFFVDGECPACVFILNSQIWDWDSRISTLKSTTRKLANKNMGSYDCIMGVSGGKDSTRLAIWARDFLGLNPLLVSVTYPPEQMTKRGTNNLNNLSELGFDVYTTSPSPIVWKSLMRKSFLESANWAKTTELALFSGVPQIAIEMGVKLILWGENPGLQLGAMETIGKTGWDGNQLRKMNTLSGMPKEWLSETGFEEGNLLPYRYPTEEEFEKHDIQIVFLGWAMRSWGLLDNGISASLNGLESRKESALENSDLLGLTSVDEDWVVLNQMIKYYKYGFGRATDYVNEWIRRGKITRDEAISIVEKYDGVCSDENILAFCDYISITEIDFWDVVNVNTNKRLFTLDYGKRPTKKFKVGVNSL
jgi:N-acetyl sugar amidotransferase